MGCRVAAGNSMGGMGKRARVSFVAAISFAAILGLTATGTTEAVTGPDSHM